MKPFVLLIALATSMIFLGCAVAAIPNAGSPEAVLYLAKCSSCHPAPHPKRHYAKDWPHLVNLMDERMRERNFAELSYAERSAILRYLQDNAR